MKLRTLGLSVIAVTVAADSLGAAAEPSAQRIEVRESGLVANLWRPCGEGPRPAVLVLGGSGGGIGWQDSMGELLSGQGYATLALAYFGMEGLPPDLDRIPVEYVERGLTYLQAQPGVDGSRMGIAGVSKGAELALLVAAANPAVRAVVAFVPSSVVWQSIADGYPETSSWTRDGRELPFVRYGSVTHPTEIADIYRAGLEQADDLDRATIPVERINGPVLLLSGQADNLWPSTDFCESIVRRLQEHEFRHEFVHVAYPDAGHLISRVREDDVSYRGGTEEGNRRAQVAARARMLAFLEGALRRR